MSSSTCRTMPVGNAPRQADLGRSGGESTLRLAVNLTVWDFTLPDHLSFLPEMNCYGLPENERDYYRLAHQHRTVLNRLPYNTEWPGSGRCAPPWDGTRLALDWTGWDRRFGPLLDGSAFADLPAQGGARRVLLSSLARELAHPDGGELQRQLLGRPGVSGILSPGVRLGLPADCRAPPGKGWTDTLFHGFLNNKNNFKANGWSRGSSSVASGRAGQLSGLLGPALLRTGLSRGHQPGPSTDRRRVFPRLVFRIDISRPHGGATALDGLVDYHVVGGAMRQYPRLVFDRKQVRRNRPGVRRDQSDRWIEFPTRRAGALTSGRWAPTASCPGRPSATAESWQKADELSLFYPMPRGARLAAWCHRSASRRIVAASRMSST